MNEHEREDQNREYAAAFDRDARKHDFDYWIVLGTRNIASQPFDMRKPMRSVISTPGQRDNRSPARGVEVPAWKKHFDMETDLLHPRSELRRMPKSLGRHYTYWTGQELHQIYVPRFLRQVARANQGPIRYGFWIEYGDWNGRPHANLALGRVKGLSKKTLANIWRGMNVAVPRSDASSRARTPDTSTRRSGMGHMTLQHGRPTCCGWRTIGKTTVGRPHDSSQAVHLHQSSSHAHRNQPPNSTSNAGSPPTANISCRQTRPLSDSPCRVSNW